MKKKIKVIIALSIILGFVSCGGEDENGSAKETGETEIDRKLSNLDGFTETLNASTEGDAPIHYADLQKYLPQNIDGYKMEDPEGSMLSMEGFSVSNAETEYTGENGNYIRISIMDYKAAQSLFQMSTAMWNMGITIDSEQEYAKSFSLNDEVNGWETFNKQNNKATVIAAVGSRLMISVEANNQTNVDQVKKVLTSMNIKSMIIVTNKIK